MYAEATSHPFDVIIEEAEKALSRFRAERIDHCEVCWNLADHMNRDSPVVLRVSLDDTTLIIETVRSRTPPYTFERKWQSDITKPDSMDEFISALNGIGLAMLPEYSCTDPTGPRVGKMWKRNLNAYKGVKLPPDWRICKATKHPDPNYVYVKSHELYTV